MAEPSGHTLFTDLLRVANRAIEAHRDESPWRELVERTTDCETPSFGVALLGGDSEVPIDRFAIHLHEGRFELVSREDVPVVDWEVSIDFLRDVARHPDRYVADPRRLQLDWLERRLGIGR